MNITYLLGAGASYNAIPVVSDFAESIKILAKTLSSIELPSEEFPGRPTVRYNQNEAKGELIKDMTWLYSESIKHASIDTFAKKLWLQGNYSFYERLKKTMSTFFIIRQCFCGVDIRYDLFFATILNRLNSEQVIPGSIKVLSWNYDYQVELSFWNFNGIETNFKFIEKSLNILPSTVGQKYEIEKFNLIKLNGTAGGIVGSQDQKYYRHLFAHKKMYNELSDLEKREILFNALDHYVSHDSRYISTLSFSWEYDLNNDPRAAALQIAAGTDILVVIGYSFPTFNREVDKKILNSLSSKAKIFVQAPEKDIVGVSERCKSLFLNPNVSVNQITSTNEFYIPYEFN